MSILGNTATLDIGSIDSGVIFDHANDNSSLGSVNTRIFMNKNMLGGMQQQHDDGEWLFRGQ